MPSSYYLGLDIGSTTVKAVVLDNAGAVCQKRYTRHVSDVRGTTLSLLTDLLEAIGASESPLVHLCITGSGGMALADELSVPFLQEVLASHLAIEKKIPDADAVIELGGEDAKLTFLTGGLEQRMNETCAGGTGAFIDQMGAFLATDAAGVNDLAEHSKTIYPIASRCGVFARMDILPLLNEGASKEDIAASVLQAVVNQTISGLAHGRKIAGKVVFLGGPLAFLPYLRKRFVATLADMREAVFPDGAQYFVALGAAFHAQTEQKEPRKLKALRDQLAGKEPTHETTRLKPLFASQALRAAFTERHKKEGLPTRLLEDAHGSAWLGFDSGSTTIKAVLLSDAGELLYSYYTQNRGDPLSSALAIVREIYARKQDDLVIRGAGATGYGSALLTRALHLDCDEVETVAHATAAAFFDPSVTFVLDIGGQDIKCMRIRDNAIDSIALNEACSSGCGSFIENFADSLHIPLPDFVEAALCAENPVDLGTRCTVFMNSRVKQAQKEGAGIGDIAAGLSYAVIRNACYKVMKITNIAALGDHVVAQGGAFTNDALLRALELELGRDVVRPSIPGLMGALGMALLVRGRAEKNAVSSLLSAEALEGFSVKTRVARCKRCQNACLLTVSIFPDGGRFVSGNRCERGSGESEGSAPNMYAWKYGRVFDYTPPESCPRGTIGIPRTLNMYEDYPLWFTLLTKLGFRVVLSSPSSKNLYYAGYATIPSQTVCYPAKLSHGHIIDLVRQGVSTIFFPCLPREKENPGSTSGTFNCPVVTGYPELLRINVEALRGVRYVCPFLPLSRDVLARRMHEEPFFADIPLPEIEEAVRLGFLELERYHNDVRAKGAEILASLDKSGGLGIILSGHPYHTDPEVHHGIAELIASLGVAVLTEDSVAGASDEPESLRVVNQWAYHARLYRAGKAALRYSNIAVLQLLSFGCGLDAITSDQLEEIVRGGGRLYAQIKLDEGTNIGPARIRIRSLIAALREKRRGMQHKVACPSAQTPLATPYFTEAMRETHTLLIPQLSPVHFSLIESVFEGCGYKAALLPHVDREAIELGLRYVNNDACYPAIIVIGQLLQAVQTGKWDRNHIALVISQTGGGCRATNYASLLRKAMVDAGLGDIPILSLATGIQGPGLRMTRAMLFRMIMAGHYGDSLARMINRTRPYEAEPGSIDRLTEKWIGRARENILSGNILRFEWNMFSMIRDFDRIRLRDEPRRRRVGIVGEILLKYHPDANNSAATVIEEEGGEVVSTDIIDFAMYCLYDDIFNYRHLAGRRSDARMAMLGIAFLELTRLGTRLAFSRSRRFTAPSSFRVLRKKTKNLISLGQQSGEGWLLGAEMVRMLENGVSNILCVQPFGCLPNHVVAKGLMRELKRRYPQANFIALDYDAGASEVNQMNRIKLMMRSGQIRE